VTDDRASRLDVALAITLAAALIVEGLIRYGDDLSVVAYPLAAATAAPLLFRRRAPLVALLLIEAGAIACVAVFRPQWTALALVMVGLFTVALSGGRLRSLVVGAVTALAIVGTIVLVGDDPVESTKLALRLLLVGAALAAGDIVRLRRALQAAALEESLREERERDEKARQRVADERMRIARELHDTLAHALVAINVRAGVAAHLQSHDSDAALLDIKAASAEALRDLRVTLGLLRAHDESAPVSPTEDLSALPVLIDRARTGGLDADIDMQVNGAAVPSPVGHAAFRIVQEALTNVLRHAEASTAHVLIRTSNATIDIEVTDDGVATSTGGDGHGLRGMKERAEALGGRVVSGPRSGGGWQVSATLPLSSRSLGGR
jgi:signal transduction histidine kinase